MFGQEKRTVIYRHTIQALDFWQKPLFFYRDVWPRTTFCRYFSNTQTSHTRPIVDGVRSSVAYSKWEMNFLSFERGELEGKQALTWAHA